MCTSGLIASYTIFLKICILWPTCSYSEIVTYCIRAYIVAAFQSVVRAESEQFQDENVTITLNWAQGDNEFYNASIIPHVPIFHIGNTAIQMMLQYNTQYSVSIIAFLCEYNTTNVVELHYGKWIHAWLP